MPKIHVWHRLSGEIVAVGRASGKRGCIPVSGENQFVLEVEVAEEDIASLHRTHFVDAIKKAIVPLREVDKARLKARNA
jgi:hypothetical protein